MKVELIDCTGFGTIDPARYAAERLVFTKKTRLEMRKNLLTEIEMWSDERIAEELDYMANTIPSSWEFVTYSFLVTDVTRGFTHQFVRTRTASFAQQTMRVLNVNGWTFGRGPTIKETSQRADVYDGAMRDIARAYDALIAMGAKIEDARGVLPTNIHTNIVAKFDLRTLADTARKRASSRTQGEYRDVMDAMIAEVLRVHPWAEKFLFRTFDKAAAELEEEVAVLRGEGMISNDRATKIIKLIDQLRATA